MLAHLSRSYAEVQGEAGEALMGSNGEGVKPCFRSITLFSKERCEPSCRAQQRQMVQVDVATFGMFLLDVPQEERKGVKPHTGGRDDCRSIT